MSAQLGLGGVLSRPNGAVSISAGVAALVSAFPTLGPDSLAISLGFLAVLTALNPRGIARTFLLPTAVFLAGIYIVIVAGLFRSHPAAGAGIHPANEALNRAAAPSCGSWSLTLIGRVPCSSFSLVRWWGT
jgi:hypothetical protein